MIMKLEIKQNKVTENNQIYAWFQRNTIFDDDLHEVLSYFKRLNVSKIGRLQKYYRITSNNSPVMLSFIGAIHDIIPEVFFSEDSANLELEEVMP